MKKNKKEKVVTFANSVAQGDGYIFRIESLPSGLTQVKPKGGKYIVLHSETGHHHSIVANNNAAEFFLSQNPLVAFLKVNEPVELRHERDFDTHDTIKFPKGVFQINRQRELTPEGWRMVQD